MVLCSSACNSSSVGAGRPDARVHKDGKRVFSEAIRGTGSTLARACGAAGVTLAEIDLVVPHQANGRTIEAVRTRLKLPQGGSGMKSAIRETPRRARNRLR